MARPASDERSRAIHRWQAIKPAMRRCGAAAEENRRIGVASPSLLIELASDAAFGAQAVATSEVGAATLRQVQALIERCRVPLMAPLAPANKSGQAILCWWAHVVLGLPIDEIYRYLRDRDARYFADLEWGDPRLTVRERMWIADRTSGSAVTVSALPGIAQLTDLWQATFAVDLDVLGARIGAVPRGPDHAGESLIPGDSSELVSSSGPAHGEVVDPGQLLTKRWTIRNAGIVPWRDRLLSREGPHEGPWVIGSKPSVQIPDTDPHGTAELVVEAIAPTSPGAYVMQWKMTDASGIYFFPYPMYPKGLCCTISVRGVN